MRIATTPTLRLPDGGMEAVQLRVAEQYVAQFGNLAQKTNTVVVPATVSDVALLRKS